MGPVPQALERYGGREVTTVGDGFLATFDSPARAIRCAAAIRDGLRDLGIDVRSGLHIGEIEVQPDDIAGLAVPVGARISALAEGGEILVSGTVRELVVGSGFSFDDRGSHILQGVPGRWRLYGARVLRRTGAARKLSGTCKPGHRAHVWRVSRSAGTSWSSHNQAPNGWRSIAMPELDTEDRERLRASQFAYIDKEGGEHLPINDGSHVRNAMARFNQTEFESEAAKEEARQKILAAAKKFDIEVDPDSNVAKGTT
jgi:hypothetical protein